LLWFSDELEKCRVQARLYLVLDLGSQLSKMTWRDKNGSHIRELLISKQVAVVIPVLQQAKVMSRIMNRMSLTPPQGSKAPDWNSPEPHRESGMNFFILSN